MKQAIFYQVPETPVAPKQFIPDSTVLKVHHQYEQLKNHTLGIDEILLKVDDPEFQKRMNFSVTDIQKLRSDRTNYIKFLIANANQILPKELIEQNRNTIKRYVRKKVKVDQESQSEEQQSESALWDSDFGEKDFEASEDDGEDRDYDD